VNVSFDTVSPRRAADGPRRRSLCCYSGGLDSTHALLTRQRAGETQSLAPLPLLFGDTFDFIASTIRGDRDEFDLTI
jgi:hypothetical protein